MSDDLFLLVDGENMDWILGDLLGHPPSGEDRIRWDPVLHFAEKLWGGCSVKAMFFMNLRAGANAPWPFIRAVKQIGYRPVLLTGAERQKVVDIGIQKTLEAIAKRAGNVLLMSHDQDFCASLQNMVSDKRKLGMLVFPENLGKDYRDIPGLEIFDVEHDARAIPNGPLQRLTPTPIEDFDAEALLDSF